MCDCIFCKIIKGEIPSYKIFEDEKTLAFLDIAGDFYGHTLVIPKTHAKNVLDVSADDLSAVMNTVKRVANHYVSGCGFDGANILNANESAGEQSVMHLHFHIIPRKNGDGLKVFPSGDAGELDMAKVVEKLKLN